jgi:hypothetical protein
LRIGDDIMLAMAKGDAVRFGKEETRCSSMARAATMPPVEG